MIWIDEATEVTEEQVDAALKELAASMVDDLAALAARSRVVVPMALWEKIEDDPDYADAIAAGRIVPNRMIEL